MASAKASTKAFVGPCGGPFGRIAYMFASFGTPWVLLMIKKDSRVTLAPFLD